MSVPIVGRNEVHVLCKRLMPNAKDTICKPLVD